MGLHRRPAGLGLRRGRRGLVGLAAFLRLAPAALAAPFAGALADRMPRRRIMVTSDLLRALTLGLAALAIATDAPVAVVLTLVSLAGIAASAFRPAESALLPSITSTPEELAAANVVASAVEGSARSPGRRSGACCWWSGARSSCSSPPGVPAVVRAARGRAWRGGAAGADGEPPRILRAVADGFRASVAGGNVRLILGLVAAQTSWPGCSTCSSW